MAEGPAEDGSAMEWGGASGRRTRRGWLCNGGRVGKKKPLRVSKKKNPQRMALHWQKDPQRMALQWNVAAPAVEGPAEDGSAMEAASAKQIR